MNIARLPAARINCGQPFAMSIQLSDNSTPVDLTGWVGRFSIATDYNDAAIVDVAPALSDAGGVAVTLTDAQTLLLQPYAGRWLVFQIDLDGPSQSHRMQGRVSIASEVLA